MNDRPVLNAAVIGGGPAGLMAAEVLSAAGAGVDIYDAMPSLGRKFLMAGKGGLNLTHSEAHEAFAARYGARRPNIEPLLNRFGPDALRAWLRGLGVETFVGSSGRVFPTGMKAAPLLRAWLHRLREAGARIHVRHRWTGWTDDGALRFVTPQGERAVHADVVILALGGGSWARLGSDAAWVPLLERRGIRIAPLQPANCGFDIGWSNHFRSKFAGQPLKSVVASFVDSSGTTHTRQGECIVTDTGIEGGLVYALCAPLRDEINANGAAILHLDLLPGRERGRVLEEIAHPRGAKSLSTHLQGRLGIKGVKAGLLREAVPKEDSADPARLAAALKALPLKLVAARPIDEAISTAGGVAFEGLDERLMMRALPGVFCAGEMLDWEAPTGGHLLSACFASGRCAGAGALAWLENRTARSTDSPTET
jgi:uncharacterized flavoprotein (TIGR03862 family)